MVTGSIDRSSPVPYYHQLKSLLRATISGADMNPGDRLPGDHRLCEAYDVSRTVVRQALTELEFEGAIERIKGRGTFVAAAKTSQGLVQSLTGLFEDAAAIGRHVRSEVRRVETIAADGPVADELELSEGTPVLVIERIRFVDEVPWVFAVTHLPAGVIPTPSAADLRDASLYAIMERSGARPVRGRRAVEAHNAPPALARDLGLAPGAAVLVLHSVGYDLGGRPVETFRASHRGDRSRFEVSLSHPSDEPQHRWADAGLARADGALAHSSAAH